MYPEDNPVFNHHDAVMETVWRAHLFSLYLRDARAASINYLHNSFSDQRSINPLMRFTYLIILDRIVPVVRKANYSYFW